MQRLQHGAAQHLVILDEQHAHDRTSACVAVDANRRSEQAVRETDGCHVRTLAADA